MLKKFVPLIAILIFLSSCSDNIAILNQENNDIKDFVEVFTSDEMEGRLTGTTGNNRAVQFIEEKFKEIGLVPFKENNYLQAYPHQYYDPEKIKFEINIKTEDGRIVELQRGIDFLERSGFTNYKESFPFTFDIHDPELENSFIVLENRENFEQVHDKVSGILLVEDSFKRMLNVNNMKKPFIQINKDTYEMLKKESKGQLEITSRAELEEIQAYNVVGKIPGNDSTNAVVLSAHFDHVGKVNDTVYRGAIDNASGVAILLDVAKKLSKYTEKNGKFQKDIVIVAFNGEESGLQGSKHYTDILKKEYKHLINVNLDAIYDAPIELLAGGEEAMQELLDDVTIHFKNNDLPVEVDTSQGLVSDYASFLSKNINAVSLGSQKIMDFIHSPSDTIDKINFPFLEQVSEVVAQFVINHDNRTYEYKEVVYSNEEFSEAELEEFKEMEKMYEKEKEKLKYNEYKVVISKNSENLDHYRLIDHQFYTFNNLKEFSFLYPDIKYKNTFKEYNLKEIMVFNSNDEEIDVFSLEADKIYEKEISKEDIQYISLKYYLQKQYPNNTLHISIKKDIGEKYDDGQIEKPIQVNGMTYQLNYHENLEYLGSFSYNQEVNGQTYTLDISKGTEVNVDFNGKKATGLQSDLTERDVMEIIREKDIKEAVDVLLKSL
ncbi:hypothetical protein PB01_11725 [Psychrobacillus glaciei]|uniref:Peptidase M28 domain-containing protein n=1 Tax=Psychrobacillus glaciei TaxID=2283160 RepID=A0A5J6SNF4_9BACI|nr:M28 family metallopeptidase [Psychrobacillus glaciei]QFF99441.1 hypothetical protein PB01_11725 [Psychrobacillus glaciei]